MDAQGTRIRIVFACLGIVSVMAQVILMRRLMSVFSGNELTVGAALAGWMIWTGLGSAFMGRAADRLKRPREILAGVYLAAGLALPATVVLTYTIKPWLGYSHAEMVGLEIIILASVIVTGPLCFALGFAFNLCCRMIEETSTAVGRVYLWEALGSALAGVAFSFILAGRVSIFQQVYLVMSILFAAAGLSLKPGWMRRAFALLVLASIIGAGVPGQHGLSKVAQGLRWRGHNLLLIKESRYGELSVTEREGEITFYANGVPAFTHPVSEPAERIVHLPLSICKDPERILLIGGGLTELADELMKYRFKSLEYVQIDPELTRLEERFIPEMRTLEEDDRVSIFHRDGRRHLKLAGAGPGYDACILNLPDPETAQLNRFYTTEFFELVKSRLNPGGVLGLTAGTSGNYLSNAQALLLGTVYKSLDQVFDRVVILPLGTNYLVAGDSESALTDDPDRIANSLKEKGIKARFVREYYLEADLSQERLDYVNHMVDSAPRVSLNHDLRPRGYFLGLSLWLEQAQPSYRALMESMMNLPAFSIALIPVIIILIGIPLALIFKTRAAAVAAVGAGGFVTMAAEVVVIISFQVIHGYVYHLLGLIVAVFMIGLVAGARLWGQAAGRVEANPALKARIFLGSLALFTILPLILMRAVPALVEHQPGGTITFLVLASLLFVIALASGFIFPASASLFLIGTADVGRTAGWINGSDHLGAALGALVISAFTVPLFGLGASVAVGFFVLVSCLLTGVVGLRELFLKAK
jgi:spermidine synthase